MVIVNFQCWGVRPTTLDRICAGGVVWIFFSPLSFLFFLPLSGRRHDVD